MSASDLLYRGLEQSRFVRRGQDVVVAQCRFQHAGPRLGVNAFDVDVVVAEGIQEIMDEVCVLSRTAPMSIQTFQDSAAAGRESAFVKVLDVFLEHPELEFGGSLGTEARRFGLRGDALQ